LSDKSTAKCLCIPSAAKQSHIHSLVSCSYIHTNGQRCDAIVPWEKEERGRERERERERESERETNEWEYRQVLIIPPF